MSEEESIWKYNAVDKTFIDMHKLRLRREGYLMAMQEMIEMLRKRCEGHPWATTQYPCLAERCHEHNMILQGLKKKMEKLSLIHVQLNDEMDKQIEECVELMKLDKPNNQ